MNTGNSTLNSVVTEVVKTPVDNVSLEEEKAGEVGAKKVMKEEQATDDVATAKEAIQVEGDAIEAAIAKEAIHEEQSISKHSKDDDEFPMDEPTVAESLSANSCERSPASCTNDKSNDSAATANIFEMIESNPVAAASANGDKDEIDSALKITDTLSHTHAVQEDSVSRPKKTTYKSSKLTSVSPILFRKNDSFKKSKYEKADTKSSDETSVKKDTSIKLSLSSANSFSSIISKASSKASSKNPADSNTSTATSTQSESKYSGASGSTRKTSNRCATSDTPVTTNVQKKVIQQSYSFAHSPTKKETPPIHPSRSMSPGFGKVTILKNKLLSPSGKKDERESITSGITNEKYLAEEETVLTDKKKSLPPRIPPLGATKEKRELIAAVIEAEYKRKVDDDSVEVVSVAESSTESKCKDKATSSTPIVEAINFGSDGDEKCTVSSKSRKSKMGKKLMSRGKKSSPPNTNLLNMHNVDEERLQNEIGISESDSQSQFSLKHVAAVKIQAPKSEAGELQVVSEEGSDSGEILTSVAKSSETLSTTPGKKNEGNAPVVPVTQIDFDPTAMHDNEDVSLDPALKSLKIWEEDPSESGTNKQNRFMCGGKNYLSGFINRCEGDDLDFKECKEDMDDLSIALTKVTNEEDDEMENSPFLCGIDTDEFKQELTAEIKESVSELAAGMKLSLRKMFGACDITSNGGVEVLAASIKDTQKHFVRGPKKRRSKSKDNKAAGNKQTQVQNEISLPTETTKRSFHQQTSEKKSEYVKKMYMERLKKVAIEQVSSNTEVPVEQTGATNVSSHEQSGKKEMSIVEKQAMQQEAKERESEKKKKAYLEKLKTISLTHL